MSFKYLKYERRTFGPHEACETQIGLRCRERAVSVTAAVETQENKTSSSVQTRPAHDVILSSFDHFQKSHYQSSFRDVK